MDVGRGPLRASSCSHMTFYCLVVFIVVRIGAGPLRASSCCQVIPYCLLFICSGQDVGRSPSWVSCPIYMNGLRRRDTHKGRRYYIPRIFKISSVSAMLTSEPATTCKTVWRRKTTRDQLTRISSRKVGSITAP